MTNIDTNEVKSKIESGLMAYYQLARKDIKGRWKKFDRAEKYAVARALVKMHEVAKNYEKYFSRENTESAWRARAAEYAEKHDIKPARDAFYIVQDPCGLVFKDTKSACFYPVAQGYYCFLNDVQRYEYDKETYGDYIVKVANKVRNVADLRTTKNPIKKVLLSIKNMVR